MKFQYIVFDHDGTLVDMERGRVLYPGLKELLVELHKNAKLYIWTARDRFSTIQSLKNLEILSLFEDISTSTDTIPKPSPNGLYEMLGETNPKDVCVIGDSAGDMWGATKIGCFGIGAAWNGFSSGQYLIDAGASKVCESVDDLKKFLSED